MRKQRTKKFLFVLGVVLCLGLFGLAAKPVFATGPNLISFQGKVVNADGTNVTNGSYNFDFVLYDDASLGTPSDGVHDKWHELTKSVTVTNGVFQTELGSATTLPDFNTNSTLYLAIKFNGDAAGYMTPRIHLDSVPYARNADNLGGLSSSAFAQLSAANAYTNTNIITVGSSTAFQVINGSSKEVLTVDTTGNQLLLGKAGSSGLAGKLTFNTATASSYTVSLTASNSTTASYSLTLPTGAPSTSQCVATDSVTATQLIFTSCGAGGGVSSIGTIDSQTKSANGAVISGAGLYMQTADGTYPGLVSTGTQTFAGAKTFTSALTIKVDSANALAVQDSGGHNGLVYDTTNGHLRVYEDTTTPTNYLDIYYDNATSSGIIAASSGTTKVGSASGPITINAGSGAAVTITGHAASTWSTDSGALTITGSAASTWSLSSGALTVQSGGANALNLDAGGSAAVNIGNTNATSTSLCNSTACDTVSIGTNADADAINIGDSTDTTTVAGAITLSGFTSCASLTTNSSGVLACGTGPDTSTFTDSTSDTLADNNTTDLWDGTYPNITPISSSQTILVSVNVSILAAAADDEQDAVQVYRTIGGTTSSCSGTAVGTWFTGSWNTNTSDNFTATTTFLDTPATTSKVNYTVCSDNHSIAATSVNNTTPHIDFSLAVLGADYAENYYTRDSSVAAGDVVSIDSTLPAGAKKSTGAYDKNVLGIVSTAPGKVLDDKIGAAQGRPVPVALSGRVPVKVTTENGPIKVGDLLTASSTPGVAMRATKAGQVIGQAMTPYSGNGVGQVFAFVKTDYANGTSIDELMQGLNLSQDQPSGPNSNPTNLDTSLLAGLMNLANQQTAPVSVSDIVTDRIAAGLEIVTPKVTTDQLAVNSIAAATGMDIRLKLGDSGQFVVTNVAGDNMITFDVAGNATFAGTITADKIKANQIEGLEILTDKISSLSEALAGTGQSAAGTNQNTALKADGDIELGNLRVQSVAVTLNLNVDGTVDAGGLTVNGPAEFKGETTFQSLVTFFDKTGFKKDVNFDGRVTFNNDAGGTAVIKKGAKRVEILFAQPYPQTPVVNANYLFNDTKLGDGSVDSAEDKQQRLLEGGFSYAVSRVNTKSFVIILNKPADEDLTFNWLAISVKDAKVAESKAD